MIFAFCKKYGNFIKNGGRNCPKIDAKIIKRRLWAAKGTPGTDCDCFLGGFWRSLIFDEFSIGKKSIQNQKNAVLGGIWDESLVFWGRVGGRGGGHGRLLESDKSLAGVCTEF